MTVPYTYVDAAEATVATGGGRSIGGPSITVATGKGALFGAGSPSVDAPMSITVYRSSTFITVLKCVGVTGDALTIDGAWDDHADAAVQAGDEVNNGPTKKDMNDLWSSVGGGASIGGDVGGGTAKSVLFVDASGDLGQDAGLTWDASSKALAVGGAMELRDSGGVATSAFDANGYGFVDTLSAVLADGADLTTGVNLAGLIANFSGRIDRIKIAAGANGGGCTLAIKKNGTSIFASNPTIYPGVTAVKTFAPTTTDVSEDDLFTIDCASAGSGVRNVRVQVVTLVKNVGGAIDPGGGFDPSLLAPDVLADSRSGVFTAASGGSEVASDGTVVNGWVNNGSLGGRFVQLQNFGSPVDGGVYRTNSGAPYLEFGASSGRGFSMQGVGGSTLGDFTRHFIFRHDHTGQSRPYLWCTAPNAVVQDNGSSGVMIVDKSYNYTKTSDDGPQGASNIIPVTDDRFHIGTWRRASRVWTFFVDGASVASVAGTSDPTAGGLNIGMGGFSTGYTGGVALVLNYSAAHSDDDVQNVCNYYLDNHPLLAKDDKVMVVCGDSTSVPLNAFASWADQTWLMARGTVWQYGSWLQSNSGLGRFWNNSYGGKSTSQHVAEVDRIAHWLNRGTSKRVLVINTGTNDIRAGGAGLTPAQSHAQILSLIAGVRGAVTGRVEVVVATICDGNPAAYTGFTALRNTLNGLIVSGAASGDYAVARVDLDDIGLDWGDPARLDTYFYGDPADSARDGLHRIAPGMDREAVVIRAAVAGVL